MAGRESRFDARLERLGQGVHKHPPSLELGGDPVDPRNLWPEPYPRAAKVDSVENQLNALVCDGKISLAEGQRRESSLKHTDG